MAIYVFFLMQAWVFAALDDEDDASSLYFTYAFLYAIPYVSSGLELDTFVALSIITGVAHVQVRNFQAAAAGSSCAGALVSFCFSI